MSASTSKHTNTVMTAPTITTTTSECFDEPKKSTTPLINVDSVSTTTSAPSLKPQTSPERQSSSSSWRSKLHIHSSPNSSARRSKSVEPGKERWRDATLSEKERWKDWQKAKDKEQMRGSTLGVFNQLGGMLLK